MPLDESNVEPSLRKLAYLGKTSERPKNADIQDIGCVCFKGLLFFKQILVHQRVASLNCCEIGMQRLTQ